MTYDVSRAPAHGGGALRHGLVRGASYDGLDEAEHVFENGEWRWVGYQRPTPPSEPRVCTITKRNGHECLARPIESGPWCIGHQRSVAAALVRFMGGKWQ